MEKLQISAQELFPILKEQLARGRNIKFTVTGSSMLPWIVGGRDSVELISAAGQTLKKGNIILYQSGEDHYILHRITQVTPNGFITTGDGNCWRDGETPARSVIGKVTVIYRKNRIISCTSIRWKLASRIWMVLFPIRKPLLKVLRVVGKTKK